MDEIVLCPACDYELCDCGRCHHCEKVDEKSHLEFWRGYDGSAEDIGVYGKIYTVLPVGRMEIITVANARDGVYGPGANYRVTGRVDGQELELLMNYDTTVIEFTED